MENDIFNEDNIVRYEPPPLYKYCEGRGCSEKFKVNWQGERRCERCRREKREYKKEDEPF